MESPLENNNGMVHFAKINIFGDSGVGKSTLISKLKNFKINLPLIKNESKNDSFDISKNLVEQVQKVVVPLNEYKNMHFLLYETKVNDFEFIKTNLDTLLLQTECIIIMWDQNNSSTFDMIPDLIKSIYSLDSIMKENIGIYLIQNKTDLEFDNERISDEDIQKEIDKLIDTYKNIYKRKMQFLNKEDIQNLLYDLNTYLANRQDNKTINEKSVKLPYPLKEINNVDDVAKYLDICIIDYSEAGEKTFLKKIIETEDNIKKELNYLISVNDEEIYLRITYSSEKLDEEALKKTMYKKYHGFLLLFDVTNKNSFDLVKKEAKNIISDVGGKIIIAANKIDEREERKVPKSEGQNLAKEFSCDYYECSSACIINLNEIFNILILLSYYKFKEYNMSRQNSIISINQRNSQTNIFQCENKNSTGTCSC